jgi:hypothetical protein
MTGNLKNSMNQKQTNMIVNNRWKYLFSCLVCVLFSTVAQAQRFEESMVSTADHPKWFVIQVRGLDATAGLIVTENNGAITGETLKTVGSAEISKQLWRIESGTSTTPKTYHIINKLSGKKLDIAYSASRTKRIAVVSETPLTEWRIINNYNLRAVTEPDGGIAGQCYLLQTGSEDSYSLIFTSAASISNDNAKFEFWSQNSLPQISTEDETVWLRIRNAKTSLTGKYLADVGDATTNGPFLMVDSANDLSQQWKIVLKSAPAESGRVDFVNRATGRAIGTGTVYDTYYYLQAFTGSEENEGWRLQAQNSNALYEIASGSLTGAWFWNATADGEAPRRYSGSPDKEQGYAWQFSLVEEATTGVQPPEIQSHVRVYTRDRSIYVEGADRYTITDICGLRVPNNRQLPVGVYLVNVNSETIKVLVR